MNNRDLFWLLVGFLSGAIPILGLVALYYVKALRRVKNIQRAVENYRASNLIVGKACDRVFGNTTEK